LGKKLSLLIAYKILVAARCITKSTDVNPAITPTDINPGTALAQMPDKTLEIENATGADKKPASTCPCVG